MTLPHGFWATADSGVICEIDEATLDCCLTIGGSVGFPALSVDGIFKGLGLICRRVDNGMLLVDPVPEDPTLPLNRSLSSPVALSLLPLSRSPDSTPVVLEIDTQATVKTIISTSNININIIIIVKNDLS